MNDSKLDYLSKICVVLASKSTCPRASVGCLITDKNGFILSTGYNGAPSGVNHCLDVGCDLVNGHCVASIHAEQNAILSAARNGFCLKDCIFFCTHSPCRTCANLILGLKVKFLYFGHVYDQKVIDFLLCNGVVVKHHVNLTKKVTFFD